MEIGDAFYLYPLYGKYLKYFVNRGAEIDYAVRNITEMTSQVIGVVGSTDSGKTSFLYALEDSYLKRRGMGKVLWTNGKDFLSDKFELEKDVDVLFVDDCAFLSDEDAVKIYEKMYYVAMDKKVNIVYTDRIERGFEVLNERKDMTTARLLYMDATITQAKEIFVERLKRVGYGDMFEERAINHIVFRSAPNLRLMFQYGKEAYTSTGKVKGITVEEVDEAIINTDIGYIRQLGDVAVAIVNVLNSRVKKGDYYGITISNLISLVRDELGVNVSPERIYRAMDELAKMNILLVKKVGREKNINTIYNRMNISFIIESMDKSMGEELEL